MKRVIVILLALAALVPAARAEVNRYFMSTTPRFTWGAGLGASVDMSGNDMSTLDFHCNFGLRKGWLNFAGVGVEANFAVANSCRFFPIYAELQTNFVNRPTIAFWDIKLGTSLNYLENNINQAALYGFTGVGFNLARSAKFSSHIIVGYTFRQRRNLVFDDHREELADIHAATVKISVLF